MVTAVFRPRDIYASACGLWQWDYGQVLRIQGIRLPPAVEVHFSLQETGGTSVTRVGTAKDGVTDVPVPDSMLEGSGSTGDYNIFAFIYLTDETSGQTEYKIRMSVKARPKPEASGTPEDTDLFRNAIAAVNDAAGRAENAEASAEAWAHGREDYPERAEDNAAYYAGKAAASQKAAATSEKAAQTAEESSQKSAQNAQLSADRAAQSTEEASGYMDQSQSAAENALLSEQAAKTAQTAAEDAQAGAETAEDQAEQHAAQTAADRETVEAAKELVLQMGQEVVDNKAAVERTATEFGVTAQRAVNTVNAAGQEQVNQINIDGANQVQAVNNAGGTQVQAVNSAGATQAQAVNTAGAAQVQAVENEGTEQVANVQEAAAEIKADRDQIEMNWELASSAAPGIVQTAQGSSIAVTDSSDRPFRGLKVFGKSIQKKTDGKNLISGKLKSKTPIISNGVTIDYNGDGGIKISGTPTNTTGPIFTLYLEDLDLSMLTIDKMYSANKELGLVQYYSDGSMTYNKRFTYSENILKISPYVQRILDNYVDGEIIYPMLNEGSEVYPYEPYTGGIPSPNPEYPQEIVSIGQQMTTGAQLFDASRLETYAVELSRTQITIKNNDDGSFYVESSGTISGTFSHMYSLSHEEMVKLFKAGDITLDCGDVTRPYFALQVINEESAKNLLTNWNSAKTTAAFLQEWIDSPTTYVKIGFYNAGTTGSGKGTIIRPMIYQDGDGTWEPYTGGIPGVADKEINLLIDGGDQEGQILPINLQGGLPGIPVSSGGNYTDENGQQWIANYRDWGRGVDVQRIGQIASYNGEEIDTQYMSTTGELTTGAKILYVLATPLETPIPANEIAAYRALHTNSPVTTITNDADAYMQAAYLEDPGMVQQQTEESIEKLSSQLGNISFSINAEDGGLDLIYEQEVHNV